MKTLIKYELRQSVKILLIWLAFVIMLCGFACFEFLSLTGGAENGLDTLSRLMNDFPRIFALSFGVQRDLNTALGWYGCIYFWVGIPAFSYAVYLGLSCVMKEKRRGTAEYLFTMPVSRSQIIIAKTAACICNLFFFAVFSGLCCYFFNVRPLGGLAQKGAVFATTAGLFFTQVILFALAFLVSGFARSYRMASRIAAVLLLTFYGLYVAADYLEVPELAYFTPLKYFDIYDVAETGINALFMILGIVLTCLSILISNKCWNEKEL